VVVATVDGLGAPGPAPEPTAPDLSWAPALTGFVPPADLPVSRAGAVGGTMEVTITDGDVLTISVTYTGFTDDGDLVLDGTEVITNEGGPTGSLTYDADLVVSGGHTGYLRAIGVAGTAAGGFTGTVESDLDGHTVTLTLG
jgi:hypothetical protein